MDNSSVDLSVVNLFLHADIVVKTVMALMMLFSVLSWAIIFEKWSMISSTRSRMFRFEKRYRNADYPDIFYEKERERQDNPLSEIFVASMYEFGRAAPSPDMTEAERVEDRRERIAVAASRVRERALETLEARLGFLATIASAAPFIGLFGTVWGIVHSFRSIAESKNTSLAVVAPGIAEALLATGIGLFAAIPAMMFYNMFVGQIRGVSNKIAQFCDEMPVLLARARK